MRIKQAKQEIKKLFSMNEFEPVSPMLWSAPGIGKSALVYEVAEEMGATVKEVRLLLYKPTDITGYPILNKDTNRATFARPDFLPDENDQRPYIIFFDEITAAPPSTQAAAYQAAYGRQIGPHKFPKNTYTIFAGNRTTDRGVAYSMPSPLANRCGHIDLEPNLDDWKEWALAKDIDPLVISFLNFRPDLLHAFPKGVDFRGFPTPRTWEMVSNVLQTHGTAENNEHTLHALVGEGTSIEFVSFARIAGKVPDTERILDGEFIKVDKSEPDVMHALSGSLVYRLRNNKTQKRADNFIRYIMDYMPADFSFLSLRDALAANIRNEIISSPVFTEFTKKNTHFTLDI